MTEAAGEQATGFANVRAAIDIANGFVLARNIATGVAVVLIGILLVVSNPVDVLTYAAWRMSGLPKNRVLGSGTVLDTGRLKQLLGEKLEVDSRNVHAFIIGEHGDSELAAWSDARVGGLKISDFCELRGHFNHEDSMTRIFDHVKNSAYEIISKKHATYYGIAMAVVRICSAIVRDEKSIMPVSSLMTGEYGLYDVVLSIPAVVDANGIETVVPIELSETELLALKKSADILLFMTIECSQSVHSIVYDSGVE